MVHTLGGWYNTIKQAQNTLQPSEPDFNKGKQSSLASGPTILMAP